MRSRFIVLEGLDGSGKSTQTKLLVKRLAADGHSCFPTLHPSNSRVGELVRAATKGAFPLVSESFALMFAADFCQNYHEAIAPRLEQGDYVLCDRYYYSSLAYQGTDTAAMERIIAYNKAVMTPAAKRPDIVFFIDVPPAECMRRISSARPDTSIYETLPRLEQVRERYFAAFARLKQENIVIIQAADVAEEAVTTRILRHLDVK